MLEEIIGLLNAGNGVLLFNTHQLYLEVFPRGEFLDQEKLEICQKTVEAILKKVRVSVEGREIVNSEDYLQMNKHVFFQIVPMHDLKQALQPHNKESALSLFTVRLIVKPPQGRRVEYFYRSADFQGKAEE